ncbi:MAG: hypothetical protein ACLU6B_12170 [Lachnospirales bacterium]
MGEAGLEDRRGKRKKDQAPRTELEKAQIEIKQLGTSCIWWKWSVTC